MTTATKEKKKATKASHNMPPSPPSDGSDGAAGAQQDSQLMPRSESSIRSEISAIFAECAERLPEVDEAATEAVSIIQKRGIPIMLVSSIVHEFAAVRIHSKRAAIRQTLRKAADGDEASIARVAAGYSWLRMYMVGGKPLGMCNREDLEDAARRLDTVVEGFKHSAAFFRAIARKIGNRTVSEVLTDQEVAAVDRSV